MHADSRRCRGFSQILYSGRTKQSYLGRPDSRNFILILSNRSNPEAKKNIQFFFLPGSSLPAYCFTRQTVASLVLNMAIMAPYPLPGNNMLAGKFQQLFP